MLVFVDVLVVVWVPEYIGTGVPQHNVTLVVDVEGIVDLYALLLGVAPSPVHALVAAQGVAEFLFQRVGVVLSHLRLEWRRVFDLDVYFYFRFVLRVLVDRHVLLLVFVHYLLLYHLFLLHLRVFIVHFGFWRQSTLFLGVESFLVARIMYAF